METILVVDDDPAVRAMLSLSLRQAGFRVDTAADGDEALALLERAAYEALLTDLAMSPMDGLELARQARARRPSLRIALVTALVTAFAEEQGAADACFTKPPAVEAIVGWLGRA